MNLILIVSIIYILMGLTMSVLIWYTFTQYDDDGWEERRPVTPEYLYLLIFIWPMFLFAAFEKDIRIKIIPFYKAHPKFALSLIAIILCLEVIGVSILSIVD